MRASVAKGWCVVASDDACGLRYKTCQMLWFSWGDCSLEAAARDGGLARIDYADYEYLSVLNGFFSRTTVYVYGPKR